ncbi:ATP-binding protein [Bailinhaonella thermotolerans]|nr:ATP-binding protein [Bailinhaonella thermotolerans]
MSHRAGAAAGQPATSPVDLSRVCRFGANATFPEGPDPDSVIGKKVVERILDAIETQTMVRFLSGPGVGKSATVRSVCEAAGYDTFVINVPSLYPERLAIPMPVQHKGTRVLETVLTNDLLRRERPLVLIVEEPSRAPSQVVASQLMELYNGSIAGVPIPNLAAIIACDNDASHAGVSVMDLAQGSRWRTVAVTRADTPFKAALADRFPDVDLAPAFEAYERIETRWPGALDKLQPRTLEHVLYNILRGQPAEWGLPLLAGPRDHLRDSEGRVVTHEALPMLAAALNRPYLRDADMADKTRTAVRRAITEGRTLLIQGAPGVGKTAYVTSVAAEYADRYRVVYLNGPNDSPDNRVAPMPDGEGGFAMWLTRDLRDPDDPRGIIVILDEIWRARTAVMNMFLEVLQERTFCGVDVNIHAIIAMTNPREVHGVPMHVGKPDRAHADRFDMSIDVTSDLSLAYEWLIDAYGEVAEVVIDWHKECLDDTARVFANPRVLEGMIIAWRRELDKQDSRPGYKADQEVLEECVPLLRERAPVPLHDLYAMLSKRTVPQISRILRDLDRYVELLAQRDEHGGPVHGGAHEEVLSAIKQCELSQLQKAREGILALVRHLPQQFKFSLISGNKGDRQRYFIDLFVEVERQAAARAR